VSFSDPLSIVISGVTIPLPRTGDVPDGDGSVYRSSDSNTILTASHTVAKSNRTRRMLRLDTSKISADPYKPTENVRVTTAVYVVFDVPLAGYSPAEVLANFKGFTTLMAASSDLMTVKLLGGES